MKAKHFAALGLAMALLLLFSAGVLAMSSTNFLLDWYVQMSGGGGGVSSSTSYTANFTVGQSAVGPLTGSYTSPGYAAGLGYWTGIGNDFRIFLPLTTK